MKERVAGGRIVFAGLLAIVVLLPLPFGSNTQWALAGFGVLTSMLIAMWMLLFLMGRVRVPKAATDNRWIFGMWVLWLAWIGFQLVPLDGARISIVPESTYHALLQTLTYFGLYTLTVLTVSTRRRLRWLALAIVFSGVFQAVFGTLMTLSGREYGFFIKKAAYIGHATGTFINRNHLAGYLELCASVAVGLLMSDLRGGAPQGWRAWLRELVDTMFSRKLLVRGLLTAMIIGLVVTHSRGGNLAFFASLMLCGSVYVLLRQRRLFVRAVLLFASFLLVDLAVVSQYFGLEQVAARLEGTTLAEESRAQVLPEFTAAANRHWLTGSGLGTFAIAALPYRRLYPEQYYDHAHNDYVELLVEVGVIGLVLLALLVLATALHALRVVLFRRNPLRTGMALAALMAMTAIAIHSLVDFNLEIPANAATLVIIMAMVNTCSHGRRHGPRESVEQSELERS